MSRFRHCTASHRARKIFALAGAIALALVTFANSAQAGCGDYVFVRNANGKLVRASTLMQDHGGCTGPHCPDYHPQVVPKDANLGSREETPPSKLPCQGPNCSDRSQLPPAPVPTPVPQRGGEESTTLLLKSNGNDCDAGGRFGGTPSNHDHELHYPQFIFHPPR
jgi:hypothetical protein